MFFMQKVAAIKKSVHISFTMFAFFVKQRYRLIIKVIQTFLYFQLVNVSLTWSLSLMTLDPFVTMTPMTEMPDHAEIGDW